MILSKSLIELSNIFRQKEELKTNQNIDYVFIDGSYFCFYCYFSVERWWKNTFPDQLDVLKNPIQHSHFVETFKTKCRKMMETIPEKLGILTSKIYIGKDCKREDIWRNEFFPDYKSNRLNKNKHVGPFFQILYDEVFVDLDILEHPKWEADDCIAHSVLYLHSQEPERSIYIITSDRDYLQLVIRPNIYLYDLSYRKLTEMKGSSGNADCDLFCKIVMGDKSDNIPAVFKKCGPKTALKYYHNRDVFEERLKKENAYDAFALNRKIIQLGLACTF